MCSINTCWMERGREERERQRGRESKPSKVDFSNGLNIHIEIDVIIKDDWIFWFWIVKSMVALGIQIRHTESMYRLEVMDTEKGRF